MAGLIHCSYSVENCIESSCQNPPKELQVLAKAIEIHRHNMAEQLVHLSVIDAYVKTKEKLVPEAG
ncbi:MAG: hypothetical protein AAF700_13505, partial [Pseudomonadota bacterium]